ncbi:uncharacterized protein [Nicotiana sylvestris]|uniref:uncharacterized protein n=1 Tax=Nicotiana sylvestris TaxID=4096 RepID=UPI00388CB218
MELSDVCLGQHDEIGKKEQAIHYLSKKFTPYEARYSLLERSCGALTWMAQKLSHYFCAYTTHLISRMDPLKYIFHNPMAIEKLVKWQIPLSEFDIVYVTQKAVKRQALADHLAENPMGGECKPLKTYFPDEEVSLVGEDITKAYDGWRMFFDGAANFKGVGIGAVLVSETGQHYLVSIKLRFPCTNNMAEYEACIMGLNLAIDMNVQELLVIGDLDLLELMKRFTKVEFKYVPRIQNELVHALATLSSMIQHPDKNFIDPVLVRIHNQPAYCAHIEEEMDGKPWFHDTKNIWRKENIQSRHQMNGAMEAANKNIKISIKEDAEVEIPSLRIIQEAELSNAKWIRSNYEKLSIIDGKRMNAVCHGQLYQDRMSRAFNKKGQTKTVCAGTTDAEEDLPASR